MFIKLYNNDCFDVFDQISDSSIDLILCDLPYNLTKLSWDKALNLDKLWDEYKRILSDSGNIALFSSGAFTFDLVSSNRSMFKYKLIWKKNVPTGMLNCKYRPMKYYEEICIFNNSSAIYNPILMPRSNKNNNRENYKDTYHYCGTSNHVDVAKNPKLYDADWVQPSDILEFDVVPNRSKKLHPTQKPVQLLEWLVKTYSNAESIILDNCMGSGSTGVACKNLNRSFIGIEVDKNYFDIASERIEGSSLWTC